MPEIAGQRLRRIGLTRGNVGDSHPRGNKTPETGLPGWGGRIRTSAWRNQNPFLFVGNQRLAWPDSVYQAITYQRLTRDLSNRRETSR